MKQGEITKAQLLSMDASSIIKAYHDGRLLPSQAVETFIAHQQSINPKLNLVVEDRYDEARKEAAHCDELLKAGKAKGTLFGIPMSIKESFDVAGMHTTGCLINRKDFMPEADSGIARAIKAQGGIILCKTNTPELCFCQETDNLLFGRANNPWNASYTTGGSSGGEAALIAAGGAAAGFGSDIGGSIRIPSHFCGVVGFKPGALQYPDDGHYGPETTPHQKPLIGYGPIAKTVRDAAMLYSVIFPDFKPPESWDVPENLPVVTFDDFGKTKCTRQTKHLLNRARTALKDESAQIKNFVPPFMKDVSEAWQLIMAEDSGEGVVAEAFPGRPKAFILDFLKSKLGLPAEHHPYLTWGMFGTALFPPDEKQLAWTETFVQQGQKSIETMLENRGVFLIPVYPTPAKKHGQIYGEIFSITMSFKKVMPFTALGNVFGLPAITVPCGFSKDGLPIGLQVLTTIGNEQTMFKVAALLEALFGGYRRAERHM